MKLRLLLFGRKPMANLDSILKSRDIANKGLSYQSYGFPSSHVWMWELDYKESWVLKNWYFWTVVLEKTLESPLEIQPVHPKGNQSWLFIVEAEALYFDHIMGRTDSMEKTLMLGKIEGRRRRGWQRTRWWMESPTRWTWFEQAPGVGDAEGNLVCCSSLGCKESDTSEWLNWTDWKSCEH